MIDEENHQGLINDIFCKNTYISEINAKKNY